MKPKKLTADQVQNTLTNAIKDAVSFIESEIAPARIRAQKYANGGSDVPYEEGRSKVVATKCRDTLRAIKPSLMRVFLQSGRPVEFDPRRPDMVLEAEQKTEYAGYIFAKNKGFMLLSAAFDDALQKKTGILKASYEDDQEVEIDEYTGLSEDQVALVKQDAEIEVLSEELDEDGTIEMKVARTAKRGRIKISAVPPEDFFIDRQATTVSDSYVCGHTSESRVGDVVAMGFDFAEVYDLAGGNKDEADEDFERRGWDKDAADQGKIDPSMRKVLLTEAYMKVDIEGTGIPRLYKFICAGDDYTILERELADIQPFAKFEVDPEAHTFFGKSLVEIIIDDQDASTSLLRGLLDNIRMVNNPRVIANDGMVNMADLMNNEIGAIIRAKDVSQVREMTVGTMAAAILPAIGYYDEVIRGKTGVSGAGMGLDADVLQSQTAQGVNAAVQAANQVSELIARYLAEGLADLFRIIVTLARQHPNPEEMMRVGGQFVPVDPRSWKVDSDLIVNVGLGTGRHEERAMGLREILQQQMGIWQSYGPTNGMVTMTNMRNTLADIAKHSGIPNADRYWQPMDPQREAMLQQQAAQAAQGQQQDPNAAFLQVEGAKVQARAQADRDRLQADMVKAQMQDDRERDKMVQDLALDAAKIYADSQVKVNTAAVQAQQAMPRGPDGRV